MSNQAKMILAAVFLGALALPAVAEVDVTALTCGDFVAMDTAGQNTAADALFTWAQSTENSDQCGSIPSQLGCGTGDKMETAEIRALIGTHCTGKPASGNVIEELRKGDF